MIKKLLFAFFIILLFGASAFAAKRPLFIAYPDFWPFFTQDADGTMTGFFYDIVNTALSERMGLDVRWNEYPWTRCQKNVREGKSDAMITVPTPERLEYSLSHPTPFYLKSIKIFTYAGHPRIEEIKTIETLDDIKKLDLSVLTYSGNGWHQKHVSSKGIRSIETHNRKGVWDMLDHERGDLVIEWPGAAWPAIDKHNLSERIKEVDVVLESMPFHLLVSKKSDYSDILPEFEATLAKMKADGTIDRILKKYKTGNN